MFIIIAVLLSMIFGLSAAREWGLWWGIAIAAPIGGALGLIGALIQNELGN